MANHKLGVMLNPIEKLYQPKKLIKQLIELVNQNAFVLIEFKDCYLMSNGSGFIEFDTETNKKYRFKLTFPYSEKPYKFKASLIKTVSKMVYIDGGQVIDKALIP